jgi:hypothetical protein
VRVEKEECESDQEPPKSDEQLLREAELVWHAVVLPAHRPTSRRCCVLFISGGKPGRIKEKNRLRWQVRLASGCLRRGRWIVCF